jgi:hypothetical protein
MHSSHSFWLLLPISACPLAFKTRTEAEAGMKTIKVCTTD